MDEKTVLEMLINITKDIGVIKADTAETKVGWHEHMRRTANLEGKFEALDQRTDKHERLFWMAAGALALVSLLGTCAAIYHNLGG